MPDPDKKPSIVDNVGINLMRHNPDASITQISKEMANMGLYAHPRTFQVKVSKKDYLRRDIAAIKKHHAETLTRLIIPLAIKTIQQAIKDKTLTYKDKYPWVKLVMDKEFRDDIPTLPGAKLTINQIQSMQVLIKDSRIEADI